MQEKRLKNKKDFILTETHWNSFFYDVIFHWFLYKHDILYIYIFLLLHRILDILFFKYKLKLIKSSTYLYGNKRMIDSRKTADIPFP